MVGAPAAIDDDRRAGRTAGRLLVVVQHDDEGNEFAFHGVFHTVAPDRQIAQTFEWEGMADHVSLDTMTFEAIDGRTKMTSVSVFQTPEYRDGMMESGMEEGVDDGDDRIDELLKTLR